MSQFSNDDILYSKGHGPVFSDDERKLFENKLTKKMVDIPKPLLEDLKNIKYQYIKSNFFAFNESMIIRVGTEIVIEGVNNLVLSLIKDEDSLINSLWMLFNRNRENNIDNTGRNVYSRKISSIINHNKKDYDSFCLRKTVYMPYSLLAQVKTIKVEFEKETGYYWIKDNTFFKIGLLLMIDILKSTEIRSIKTEEELLNKVKEVIETL